MVIYFEREAWVDPRDEQLRVTFDRESNAARFRGSLFPRDFKETNFPAVILELKFTERFPTWMRELVHCFDLVRTNMAKYIHCTDQLPRQLNGHSHTPPMHRPLEFNTAEFNTTDFNATESLL
jgi:hypothetical protein